jgi:hypothetical protein
MTEKNKVLLVTIYSLLALLSGIGTILLLSGINTFPPLDEPLLVAESAKYSLPTAILISGLYLSLGQSLFSVRHRWPLIIAIVASFFLGGAAIAYQYNGRADLSASVERRMLVIDKRMLTSSATKTYYAVVESWRAGRKEERIKISKSQYNSLSLPAELKLTLKQGALNYLWVEEYSLLQL